MHESEAQQSYGVPRYRHIRGRVAADPAPGRPVWTPAPAGHDRTYPAHYARRVDDRRTWTGPNHRAEISIYGQFCIAASAGGLLSAASIAVYIWASGH